VRGQSVPTIIVDPSSGTAKAAPEQSPPSAGLSSMVTIAVAPPGQTSPLTGEPASASALGTVLEPKVLKKKRLAIKKSAL
jgi:hypothetical protein